ncbi:nuclease-related domain-containing DEAD/DEAH box helicase [Amycolatopsis japonica]|uniref:nuclease-related domain-containing DEAD/DEAH box helicase n=1 Tax=Amycolatopsis japonica TaxID=208439 RepID=UPI0033F3B525
MIPDRITRRASQAERRVFDQLQTLDAPGWAAALHSVNLPEHARKRVCEVDFLLVGERGVLGLEVKGGAVSRRNGVWHTVDVRGQPHRLKESPLDQASSAMFALERRARREIDSGLVRRTVFGHAVVFPDCDFDVSSVEWDLETVLDSRRIAVTGWSDWLNEAGKYWSARSAGRGRLTSTDIDRFLDYFRPDFDQVRTLRQLSNDVEADVAALTRQQYGAIDLSFQNARLLFEGGAGTGKTMLAVELCRRAASTGRRVLMTCHSGVLAAFIGAQLSLDNVTVLPFHLVGDVPENSIDQVIVDEAQDVINTTGLAQLGRVLTGGLTNGRWTFLLDSNNQRGLVGSYEDAAMDLLRSFRPAEVRLQDNCRNTVEIVKATQERTGADLGVTTAGHGLDVTVLDGTFERAASLVAEVMEQLERDDIPLDRLVLLSARSFTDSVFAALPPSWRHRIDVMDLNRMRKPTAGRIGFADVAAFKGLESPFVMVELPAGTHSDQSMLYVGMTRARAGLWLVHCSGEGSGAE